MVGRCTSLAVLDELGLVLAQGHHGLGTAPFVLDSGVTSALVSSLGTVLLGSSEVSAFMSLLLLLGICLLFSLMENGKAREEAMPRGNPMNTGWGHSEVSSLDFQVQRKDSQRKVCPVASDRRLVLQHDQHVHRPQGQLGGACLGIESDSARWRMRKLSSAEKEKGREPLAI